MKSLSLTKATEEVKLSLTKMGITAVPTDINVSLLLDISYSMVSAFDNGSVARVLQRLLSIANTIDDDGNMELVLFSNESYHFGTLNAEQYDESASIVRAIKSRYSFNGTDFAPAITKILDVLGYQEPAEEYTTTPSTSFFSKLFSRGSDEAVTVPAVKGGVEGKQLLVLITDGDNGDKSAFLEKVKLIEQQPNVYLQCIGIGHRSASLQELADKSESVGYTSLNDFTQTDDSLIASIINKELLSKFAGV